MHTIDIYRGNDLFVTVKPEDSSAQVKRIMGDNLIEVRFQDSRNIIFDINDYCTVFGEKYILFALPTDKKINKNLFEYSLTMRAEGYGLSRAQYLFLGPENTLRQTDFALTGKIEDFLYLIVTNANRISSGWSMGETIPSTFKTLEFSKENCLSALGRIAEAFGTEFWIEGKKIHLTKRFHETGYTWKHGRNKGIREINRVVADNTALITRLYAFGAEKNLPSDYRDYARRLKMTDGIDYIEKNVSLYGTIEYTQLFEDIYPHRTGKVTGTNILDFSMFSDSSMDFDLNTQLMPGATAKVVFNTGQLAGYSFEIASYDNALKRFRINKNRDEKHLEVPSELFRPAVGDEYVLVDIIMPQSYIDTAEAKLKEAAESFLNENSTPRRQFTITLDPSYIGKVGITPSIGDIVWIVDNEFQINQSIRIISTNRNIVNESEYQIELADNVNAGVLSQINSGLSSNSRDIQSISRQIQNESLFNNRVVGEFWFLDLPVTNSAAGKSPLYVDNTTGKLYRLQ